MLKKWFRSGTIGVAVVAVMTFAGLRAALAKRSVMFFAWYYLGVTLALHQARWIRDLMHSRAHLIQGPRGHGKTETLSKILSLWLICRDRNVRILLVTATADNAQKHSMLVRRELETNQKLIADFGRFYIPSQCDTWTQTRFQVARDKNMKDPTFEAIGVFGSITGGRCDYLLMDDLIDPAKVNTPALIAKVQAELTGTILPLLEPGGRAWAIGTRKKFGDIYGWMIDNPMWTVTHDRAIIREPEHEIIELDKPILREDGTYQLWQVKFKTDDHGRCLWPEHQSVEDLLLKRRELGTPVFNREYQNNVIDDATADFRLAWLLQCRDEGLSYIAGHMPQEERDKYQIIMAGTDPALVPDPKKAEAGDTDYMVQIAIGLTKTEERVLLGVDRERGLSPAEVKKRVKAFYSRFEPFRISIEANSFGIIYADDLIESTSMRLMKHYTGANKNDVYEGVPHLSPLFENAKFRLPYKTDEDKAITDALIDEFHAFGTSQHDDQVMGTWICCHAILKWMAREALKRRREQQARR